MTKIYIYILFIVALTSCTSFQAKEEGTKIDSREEENLDMTWAVQVRKNTAMSNTDRLIGRAVA